MRTAVADQVDPTTPAPLGELVALSNLRPSPLNPRKRFDAALLRELTANIEKHGVIIPLLIRRRNGVGEVIDGERRYRASKASSLTHVPCVFRDDLTDGEVIEIQLLSAIQRQDLTPLEEAAGFKALIDSNQSLYSAAYIADRVGRSERWVWDRMQLLSLIPELQELLSADIILVGHAELLAKLKPEDQERASRFDVGFGSVACGLFERSTAELDLDEANEDTNDVRSRYRDMKTRTVKELEAWIARHVRFDVQHMATTAPLDFGAVAERVVEALAKPGRGKKVVPITFEYNVHPDAKGEDRTYGESAWKRADGRDKGAPVCDHAVLGTVVAGRNYGQAFDVCIARDKCAVHWKEEIKTKAKNDELRAKGQGGRAAQNEAVDQAKQKEIHEANIRRRQDWEKLEVLLDAEAINQAKKVKALTAAHAKFIGDSDPYRLVNDAETHLGSKWYLQPAATLVIAAITGRNNNVDQFAQYLKQVVKPLGLKVAPFEAIVAALQPKAPPATKPATKAVPKTVKPAKKAKRR